VPRLRGLPPMRAIPQCRSLDNFKVFHKSCTSRPIDSCALRLRPFSLLTGWFMTHRLGAARGRDVVARWCDLAERRLEYLTELFDTGRWRRYHSEVAFLENIQEAKSAVETWRGLSMREASRDNSAVDMSWLSHTQAALTRVDRLRDQPDQRPPPPVEIAAEQPPPPNVSTSTQPALVVSDEAPSVPAMDAPALDDVPVPTPDAIEQRYPLLRNAL
jgi:uncharacterized repeat protein (TIGR03809 family)